MGGWAGGVVDVDVKGKVLRSIGEGTEVRMNGAFELERVTENCQDVS